MFLKGTPSRRNVSWVCENKRKGHLRGCVEPLLCQAPSLEDSICTQRGKGQTRVRLSAFLLLLPTVAVTNLAACTF